MRFKTFQNWDVFLIFLFTRLSSVALVQTFFVPDEYYQSLEVAHKLVFGYGHLTWEWQQGIRSYGYPLIFAFIYEVIKVFRLDSSLAVIYLPRLAQALLSAYADLCFYRWSGAKKWSVFSVVSSWFWFYMCSRTLINTFEASLTTIALSKFPWIGKKQEDAGNFIWIIATLFVLRPTSAIIWLPLCLFHLGTCNEGALRLMLSKYLSTGFIVLAISIALDSIAHGSLVVTPINFFKLNIYQNIASNYGAHPWHWYLSAGIPAVLGIQILPFVMAVFIIIKRRHNHPNELALLCTIVFSVSILSLLAHKEFRFLLPLLPIMLYISSKFLAAWSRKASTVPVWLVSAIIFLGNLFPAWYLGYSHQRGTLDVMSGLRIIAARDPENTSFLFLMPCHSTPLYSHIHVNVSTRFLTCNPNLDNVRGYVDEADQFYASPNAWLRENYPPNGSLPSHLICFESLVPVIGSDILTRYKRVKQYFHCNVPVSPKVGTYVLIFERVDFR